MLKTKYDYIVIGAGSGGLTVAVGLKSLKKDVLLVSENIGGECTFSGCVPSKSLLFHSHKYKQKSGLSSSNEVLEKVRKTIEKVSHQDLEILEGVHYVIGRAQFNSKKSVIIRQKDGTETTVIFKKCIISTGSSPVSLKIKGVVKEKILTNETIFNLKKAPQSLIIVGGGPIAVEMATAFSDLGTKVTILSTTPLLNVEPRETAEIVKKNLRNSGVHIIEEATVEKIEKGNVILTNGKSINEAEYYLIAIGRKPNTKLSLEYAYINYETKGIQVTKNFKTSNRHVYAIGDCTQLPKFTHLANNQARFLVSKFAVPFLRKRPSPLPAVTFTSPPIGSVGDTKESDLVKKFLIDFSQSDRAKIEEKEDLKALVFVHMVTGKIVGVSVVGEFAEHILNFFTFAIYKKVSVFQLNNFMVPYPTYFSSIHNLYAQFLPIYIKELKKNIIFLLKKNIYRILAVLTWIILAIFVFKYLYSVDFNKNTIASNLSNIFSMKWGIPIFIAIYCLSAIVSIPATLISLVGGSIFGFWIGLILTIVASNLSSVIAFYFGKTIFENKTNGENNAGLRKLIQDNPFNAVLTARLTFVPYNLVSYISGAMNISLWKFILATIIGSLPGSIAVVSFGASVHDLAMLGSFKISYEYLGVSIFMIVVALGINALLKKKNQQKKFKLNT